MRLPVWIALGAALWVGVRRAGRRSGATDEEVHAALPGDELVRRPVWESTRAITIRTSPHDVWPWLVQMGYPRFRAGWYTPRRLDRLQWGIREPSAERIVPELQELAVGDRVPDSPDWSVFFAVAQLEPGRALVLRSDRHVLPPVRTVDFTWAFVLRRAGADTRLLIRARCDAAPRWAWHVVAPFVAVGDLVNAGAMLRGIRRRAERARLDGSRV